MKNSLIGACFVFVAVQFCAAGRVAGSVGASFDPPRQSTVAHPKETPADPLKAVTKSFPGSITLKAKQRVLEFCPDNTCDGFVASQNVSFSTLKDFAYLYIYFFSGYVELPEWRDRAEVKDVTEHVLAKPGYRKCKNADSREAARCVLLGLSQNEAIRLNFVRYDEGTRNFVREDTIKQLSEKKVQTKQ